MDEIMVILKNVRPDVDFAVEKNLIDGEILDSTDTLLIVANLEDKFGIEFTPMDLTSENFNSIEAIIKLVERVKNEQSN